jgi:hypothetical protein
VFNLHEIVESFSHDTALKLEESGEVIHKTHDAVRDLQGTVTEIKSQFKHIKEEVESLRAQLVEGLQRHHEDTENMRQHAQRQASIDLLRQHVRVALGQLNPSNNPSLDLEALHTSINHSKTLAQRLEEGLLFRNEISSGRSSQLEQMLVGSSETDSSSQPGSADHLLDSSETSGDHRSTLTASRLQKGNEMVCFVGSLPDRCPGTCCCQCHTFSRSSFLSWAHTFAGRLFITYNSFPILSPRPCDRTDCRARSKSSISLTYFFPRWLLLRALHVTMSFDAVVGIGANLHLRVPRIIPNDHFIWKCINSADVAGIQALLASKQAYPTDIDSQGRSLLLVRQTTR